MPDEKETLRLTLERQREALLWKLDGLSERDLRWPLTPTGTNLLGIVKHVASVELGYLGDVFGRPSGIPTPWLDDESPVNADMWATVDQSSAEIIQLYRDAGTHSEATIAALELDAVGFVPWWSPETQQVTLHQILVHMIAETARHLGHADIIRELTDGAVGLRETSTNLPNLGAVGLATYRRQLAEVAEQATGTGTLG